MKTIQFGNYWQSSSEVKEPIEWLVLKEEDDRMYVLSKYCLDCVPYSKFRTVWPEAAVRTWLNEDFLNAAFSPAEQTQILLSNVKTSTWFGKMDTDRPVQDKVFLPSIAEAIMYFGSDEWHEIISEQKRIARPTHYAYEKGCWLNPLEYVPIETPPVYYDHFEPDTFGADRFYWQPKNQFTGEYVYIRVWKKFEKGDPFEEDTQDVRWGCRWYLRSPFKGIVWVFEDGRITDSYARNLDGAAVRPAMWIKKSSTGCI